MKNRGKEAKDRYLKDKWADRAIPFMCHRFYPAFLDVLNRNPGYGVLWLEYMSKIGLIWHDLFYSPWRTLDEVNVCKDMLNTVIRHLGKFGIDLKGDRND